MVESAMFNRLSVFLGAALACVLPAGALELASFSGSAGGPCTATLNFGAGSGTREIWVAWGATDAGDTMDKWDGRNERVALVNPGATTATVRMPPAAQGAHVARFFLTSGAESYPVAYVRSSSREAIDTGLYPSGRTKVSCEFEMDDVVTRQQRFFGCSSSTFVFVTYINGNGFFAFGDRDDSGDWVQIAELAPQHRRTTYTVDNPGNLATIAIDGEVVQTKAITAARTKTATTTLGIIGAKEPNGTFVNSGTGRYYVTRVWDGGSLVGEFVPYVQNGAAGMRNTVTGAFHPNAATGELMPGGRTGAVAASETSAAVKLSALYRGDVWSDAQYVWDFSNGDLDGDGKVSPGDVRHALRFGTRSRSGWDKVPTIYDAASIGRDGIRWTTEPVGMSGRGLKPTLGSLDCPANVKVENGTTNTWRNGLMYPNANIPGSVTMVARVKVRDFAYQKLNNSHCMIVNNGLDWGNTNGVEFGFTAGTAGNKARVYAYYGRSSTTLDIGNEVLTNEWYDVAYSFDVLENGYAKVLLAVSGPNSFVPATVGQLKGTGVVYKAVFSAANNFIHENAPNSKTLFLGSGEHIGGWSKGGDGSNQGAKGFNGQIQRVAMWPRALTIEEIREAFVQAPVVCRVGTENGSAGEFGAPEETPDVFQGDVDPWNKFRGTLTASSPSVTVAVPLRTASHTVPYCLKVRLAETSGRTELAAAVDGRSLGSKILEPGRAKTWFIPANQLKAGSVDVTLTRRSGSGDCAIDVVELSGSAMVGLDNNANGEFSQEGQVMFESMFGQWDFKRWPRAVIGWMNNNYTFSTPHRRQRHHFWVDPEQAANHAFRYTSRIMGQGGNNKDQGWMQENGYKDNQWPLTVTMNGETVFRTQGSPNGTAISCDFAPGELKAGWNVVEWFAHGVGQYWVCNDFHRLEIFDNPQGTIFILR